MKIFEDRTKAGQELARLLEAYRSKAAIVLALPRGGVPVGLEVARHLDLPLAVYVARKIGAPFNPEYGIGAIAEGNMIVWDDDAVASLGLTKEDLQATVDQETQELARRVKVYRANRKLPPFKDKIVILADDGLATGVTALAAIRSLRLQKPKKIILAAPVCARDTMERLKQEADDVICVSTPVDFMAVGLWYQSFEQLSDDDVINILSRSRSLQP